MVMPGVVSVGGVTPVPAVPMPATCPWTGIVSGGPPGLRRAFGDRERPPERSIGPWSGAEGAFAVTVPSPTCRGPAIGPRCARLTKGLPGLGACDAGALMPCIGAERDLNVTLFATALPEHGLSRIPRPSPPPGQLSERVPLEHVLRPPRAWQAARPARLRGFRP